SQWLSRDPELRRVATITRGDTGTPTPGAMGLDPATLNAIVSNLLAAGSLVTSILAWKDSHPKSPKVRIEHGDVTTVVEGDPSETVRSILDALEGSAPTSNNPDLD